MVPGKHLGEFVELAERLLGFGFGEDFRLAGDILEFLKVVLQVGEKLVAEFAYRLYIGPGPREYPDPLNEVLAGLPVVILRLGAGWLVPILILFY